MKLINCECCGLIGERANNSSYCTECYDSIHRCCVYCGDILTDDDYMICEDCYKLEEEVERLGYDDDDDMIIFENEEYDIWE